MYTIGLAETFRAAAGYLRTNGWLRGQMGDDGGPRCAGGALMSVFGTTSEVAVDQWLRQIRFAELAGMPSPVGSMLRGSLMNYNDFVATGAADVIDLFEGIAFQASIREALATMSVAPVSDSAPQRELVGA